MPHRTTQNPSPLIPSVPQLDRNSVVFAAWRSRLKDVLAIQGVLDIVQGKIPRPEADPAEAKPIVRTERGYNLDEFRLDWDHLSDTARLTIKLTLSVDLSIRYRDVKPASKLYKTICDAYEKNTRARCLAIEDAFWMAKHDPNTPIAKWIACIRNAATDLASVKLTPNDQQICDRLLRGLDDSWKPIRDHLVYSPNEVSLDDAIGALESHEVLTQISSESIDTSVSAAKTKPKLGCWNCGQKGHHSSTCSNPSIKNKPSTQSAKSPKARAGSVSFATIGNYNDDEDDDTNSSDNDCDVAWG
ncbi:hypothetical protein Pst134EA_011132 [Puccinia striiformis f. sp. tritici]|uniref:CCHC-type domain-containing protein n=1 Tax=Puccinia striiformis f. sp. tritici PST-78 TaxID=1165861 RepID=A0A0L0UZI7_9BASI|nr:hypothetical protein Pst134EA_011132 [Puccinia striiformis f. sp. tritici]KAH9455882.1 hypothetical protein Pst134EB_012111 [Puccinia striiformis f. sp. tritici]KAH9467489.1 hypothetical protein Pst134EA_011132 [Puccinia striiformis f. sp. tritici]KAI9626608.1 hypothetical protein H4Q26_017817 [Puccinia striiformis f. sp. tritici PST-130]KNE92341.1 hypothetical protein PSTG_14241 [Puccinia striiformis f. sp. tritici PST-78]